VGELVGEAGAPLLVVELGEEARRHHDLAAADRHRHAAGEGGGEAHGAPFAGRLAQRVEGAQEIAVEHRPAVAQQAAEAQVGEGDAGETDEGDGEPRGHGELRPGG
jgi:hypothetical protein